jgi:hypothetical protein
VVVIEAGVVPGYVVAWLDVEVDVAADAAVGKLHDVDTPVNLYGEQATRSAAGSGVVVPSDRADYHG